MPLHPLVAEARRRQAAGDARGAVHTLSKALKEAPDDVELRMTEALIELQFGRLEKAVGMLRALVRRAPRNFEAQFNLGVAQRFAGRFDLALKAFERSLEVRRDDPRALGHVAEVLAILGRLGEAADVNERLRALRPNDPRPLMRLAAEAPERLGEGDIEALAALADAQGRAPGTRMALDFALGELLWKRDTPRAFRHYERANAAKRDALDAGVVDIRDGAIAPLRERPKRRPLAEAEAADRRIAERVTTLFTPERIAALEGLGRGEAAPVFVVGMPRSGTTLVERIIAAHPEASGRGEIGLLSPLALRAWPFAPEGEAERDMPPGDPARYLQGMADAYLSALRGEDAGSRRIVDKSLDNFFHVGLIHLILPNATILHVQRDPVDNCVACFRRHFRTGLEWSYDLAALGRRWVRHREVMDHWARVLPGRVVPVRYEALVAEPEPQMRRLLDACGLGWDPAVLEFHRTEGAVRTASLAQVRRPIYRSSVGATAAIRDRLGPLLDALGPHAAGAEGGAGSA